MANFGVAVPGGNYSQFNTSGDQYNLGQLPPDIAVEEQALNRRQQIANLLMSHATQPIHTGQMAGRFFVPPSWAQGANQLGQALAGTYLTNVNDESRQNLSAQNQQQTAQAIQDYIAKTSPQRVTTPAQTTTTELEGPGAPVPTGIEPGQGFTPEELTQPTGNYGSLKEALASLHDKRSKAFFQEGERPTSTTTIPGTTTMVPPTPEAVQQADLGAMTSPYGGLRHYATLKTQQEAAAKEHDLQRAAMKQEKNLDRENRIAVAKENMGLALTLATLGGVNKADLEKMRDENAKTLERMRSENRLDVEDVRALSRMEVADTKAEGKKGGKTLPGSVGGKFMENSQNLRMAERAKGLLEGNIVEGVKGDPNAVGLKGYIPDVVLQRADPGGVETRAAVANLGSMIIHDRSGAAVTASEYPRLRPFIPTDKDDADTAKKKLGQFITEYKKIDEEMTQFYSEAGYEVPKSGWHQSPGSTAASAGLPQGAKQIGTSGGKPVYEMPDGSKMIAD